MSVSHPVLAILVFIAAFLVASQFSGRILDWVKFQSFGTRDYVADKLALLMIDIPSERILLYQISLCLGLFFFGFVVSLPNVPFAVILGTSLFFVGWVIPKPLVDYLYQKRVQLFIEQMVDGLALMANGMRSGLSVVQAMGLVAQEMPNPIRQEFELILNQNKLGVSLEEAFLNLSKRILADEVEMFVTSINILKDTGGNLAETFDTITSLIRERVKVENKIRALMAQAFFQGVFFMILPPMMLLVLSQTEPEATQLMFTHPLGWAMLAGTVVLEIVGYLVVRKITKIEV